MGLNSALKTVVIAALVLVCHFAEAGEVMVWRTSAVNEYVVSGVLRKGEDGMTIKLAQSFETGRSEDEAVGAFVRKVSDQYPGYAVITTVARPLPKQATCGTAI